MEFRGHFWLQISQIWIQSGLFALWLIALALSVAALWRPRSPRYHRFTRATWLLAMSMFFGLWLGGATLEMMRRMAPISWKGLVLGLAAFSLFMTGALNLARECFDEEGQLRPGRIVLTLLSLTVAGCFFGGFALPFNSLFETGPSSLLPHPFPKGWLLALCSTQLLTVAHTLEPQPEAGRATNSPREATIWLVGFFLILAFWRFEGREFILLTAFAGFAPFLLRTWSARLGWSHRAEISVGLGLTLVFGALLFTFRPSFEAWPSQSVTIWRSWPYCVACGAFVLLFSMLWQMPISFSLRLATKESVPKAALLLGTLTGAMAATVLFGPSGGLWWSFWPLAGLFFDLLKVDDEHERKWQRLTALKRQLRSQSQAIALTLAVDSSHDTSPSPGDEPEIDGATEFSPAGRQVEER